MREFMMIFRQDKPDGSTPPPSAEQIHATMMKWQSWIKGIADKGNYLGTGRLISEGKMIKANNVITDGPYAEVKEMVGGYLAVKADTLDAAIEMAKGCPGLTMGGSVEVRSLMPIDADVKSPNFLAPKQ